MVPETLRINKTNMLFVAHSCFKAYGMLLEMDNSEFLSLFKSPESLAAMVQKAVEALKLAMIGASSSQDSRLPNSLPAEVAVKLATLTQ
ncbi:hypothetical protein CQW23_21210 [Capsicum baccatum]|uniref:PABC domain-containing protein n=1 Tax=Capsicum baccatum TaxID=33114 RepID=A0A2G2VXC8_CAPBA|nr:hypothetical protein CQW23_21210 [Capsicum baccatum]